jgi:replicative DNA helicase
MLTDEKYEEFEKWIEEDEPKSEEVLETHEGLEEEDDSSEPEPKEAQAHTPYVYEQVERYTPSVTLQADLSAEEAVLGAMMMNGSVVPVVLQKLKEESFFSPNHGKIFAAIKQLYSLGSEVDIVTVASELDKRAQLQDVGGREYLHVLFDSCPSALAAPEYADIITRAFKLRSVALICDETKHRISSGEYENANDIIEFVEQSTFDLSSDPNEFGFEALKDILNDNFDEIMNFDDAKMPTVPTGFKAIDSIIGGFRNGGFCVLAARPGIGKTSLAMNMAYNIASRGNHVAFFSLEMSKKELGDRLISSVSHVDTKRLRGGSLTDEEISSVVMAVSKLTEIPVYIDETPMLTMFELRTKAKRLSARYGLDFIVVDYLQLMTFGDTSRRIESRQQEVANISRSLKALSKELGIPILALSQLNRNSETREGGKPMLSDLRESGAVEQDADLVMFIHFDPEDVSKVAANIIIAKHRHGPVGSCVLIFNSRHTTFLDDYREFEEATGRVQSTYTPEVQVTEDEEELDW